MQKLKLGQLVDSVDALKSLAETKLPIKISYQLAKLVAEVNGELKIYDEKRTGIIMELGKKNEETGDVSIDVHDKEAMEKFAEKFKELLEVEVEVNFANKINIADLGDVQIAPKDLPDWLFSVEE